LDSDRPRLAELLLVSGIIKPQIFFRETIHDEGEEAPESRGDFGPHQRRTEFLSTVSRKTGPANGKRGTTAWKGMTQRVFLLPRLSEIDKAETTPVFEKGLHTQVQALSPEYVSSL
jgi:hypothetical protein